MSNLTISPAQYFGPWYATREAQNPVTQANCENLLVMVNSLLVRAQEYGIELVNNPATNSLISGSRYGGFRPQNCPEGAPDSSHKIGAGVDVYDPEGFLDEYLTDDLLEQFRLYREHPGSTRGWCHLTTRSPRSGRRSFYP